MIERMSTLNNNFPRFNGSPNQYTPMYNEDGLLQTLLNAMKGEAAAVDFYSRLAELAPNSKDQNDILKIAEEERLHLQSFVNLFYTLTKRHPQYEVERVAFNTFEEGLQEAFEDELKDYETYRNQYLKTRNQAIRDVFFRAFSDEIKHATRFNAIRISLSENPINPNNEIKIDNPSDSNNSNDTDNLRNTDIPSLTKEIKDYGPDPFVVDINEITKRNNTFRTALWTGEHLQLTLMSIDVGGEIGVEMHPDTDQFLRIEEGEGIVRMGRNEKQFDFEEDVYDDYVVLVPAGKWHNIINTGDKPLKIYSIYAPPHHPHGTIHRTKEDAEAAEEQMEE
ncbi:mannose-6-phosphate isomerase-like protein (cupin superfamily) [Ureibacillus acetophenoni]|uniref:Mannose-6-phosphate isomerase-like protein (Cupin superfamily) n=2 Tax=Ureibacillus acetophenoni TaxID=614649 RepID=A0A285UD12_9BACL|nr:mannose-6-phosphate isomerase-like protein (cupin superfamily) [Ureibacillus acetophenoni]